jgi:glycosyltransferase involved in cell wall biosynthesis
MALSPSDGQALQELVSFPVTEENSTHHHHHRIRVILPMLRNEFRDIAKRDSVTILDASRHRPYFACIVRLSRDKGPQRFVKACLEISQRDPTFWSRTRTIPVLAGAASQEDFADDLKRTLRAGIPEAMIVPEFLDAEALARLLQDTRLNLHPALYEAFGMTIVEAAACGVPTLLSKEKGAIGAEELISIDKGCAYGIDLEDEEALTSKVMELLQQPPQEGAAMAEQAYQAAMTWTESEHCCMLWGMISDHQKSRNF